jgi:hypothetical protein
MKRFVIAFLLCSANLLAQSNQPQQPPCTAPEFHQFDFWVGDWDLSWPNPQGGGELHGENHVVREFGNCVVHENFSDHASPLFKGQSVSTYVPNANQWKQTWVDNQGEYLDFSGAFKDGQMILSRSGKNPKGQNVMQRMVFKNIQPDSFDWSWESSPDEGKTWKVQWPIRYTRKKSGL